MSKSSTGVVSARDRVVRRLAATVALSVALQAAAFLLLAWIERWCAGLILDAIARSAHGALATGSDAIVAAILLVVELFTALVVGFVGARRLLRSIVRATPHPMQPPTKPIPWAAACAGGIVAAVSILTFASSVQPLASPGFGWSFEILRDAAVIALFWFAATRVLARAPRP